MTSFFLKNGSHHMACLHKEFLKFHASAINSYWKKCDKNIFCRQTDRWTDRQTHKGKAVYPLLLRSRGIIRLQLLCVMKSIYQCSKEVFRAFASEVFLIGTASHETLAYISCYQNSGLSSCILIGVYRNRSTNQKLLNLFDLIDKVFVLFIYKCL